VSSIKYPTVNIVAVTDIGNVRLRNEDSLLLGDSVCNANKSGVTKIELSGDIGLAAVADGLGGHPEGDRASRTVTHSLANRRDLLISSETIVDEIREINHELYEEMAYVPAWGGMGCTLAALITTNNQVFGVNVGDSPIFEYVDGYLVNRATLDSPLVANGKAVPSNIVTQTMGGSNKEQRLEPHVWSDDLTKDRKFLLCSDGLSNFVSIGDMEQIMESSSTDDEALSRLFHRALDAGGSDNISIILAAIRV
jgi:serine/threonine protein phosphatase PrpC